MIAAWQSRWVRAMRSALRLRGDLPKVAIRCASAGAMPPNPKDFVDELTAAGHRIHAFSVDARQAAEVQKLFAEIESCIGPIEVCLFNAGSNVNKPLLDATEKLFFKAWELACYAGFFVGQASPLAQS